MATRSISRTIAAVSKPNTNVRTATVVDIIAPFTDDNDVSTGWQVQLNFGGGEIKRAVCAASYIPVPGDVVAVVTYRNTLLVIDKIVAGDTGLAPGGRVGYAYYDALATANFATAPAGTEILVPSLALTVPLRNGAAYDVEVGLLGYSTSIASSWASLRFRQDSLTGGGLGDMFRQPTTQAGVAHGFQGSRVIRNDTGFDFDATIVLTVTAPAGGTASIFASVESKPYIEVRAKGSSKLYPHATAVAAPADVA